MDEITMGVEEAAAFLRVNRTTILEIAGSGELPGARVGREWVFFKSDLVIYLKRQIQEQVARRRAEADASKIVDRSPSKPDILPDIMGVRRKHTAKRKPVPVLPDLSSPEFLGQVRAA